MKYIITEEQLNNTAKSIINLIDKEGIITASKFVSGYNNLKELLGDYEIPKQFKIDAIKEFVDNNALFGDGVHLGDIDEWPIPYREDSGGYYQIESLNSSGVGIMGWGGYKNQTEIADYDLPYEELTSKTLDDIIEMLINHL
jgi:hypothetical protein